MPVINRFAELADEITAWRHDFHRHPELLYETHRTAATVAERLRAFGCDAVVEGVGRTGVVGVIHGAAGPGGRVIALRADMDALPITEATGLPHASRTPGVMHACGHDGHTAMLLGAARYLAETRNFAGTAVVVFQPAEEGGAGAKAMLDDGLIERFGIDEVYGMHNMPNLDVGRFAIRPGPIMAAADQFTITVEGRGGHAAKPNECIDTTLVASHIVVALQSIVARNVDPLGAAVVSVTGIRSDTDTFNVIPQRVRLVGTARSLDAGIRDQVEARLAQVAETTAAAFGARATLEYRRNYPVTANAPAQTAFAASVARAVAGDGAVDPATPPVMGGEDFSFMLEARPGAFIFVGNGASAALHHPEYDFNDAVIPIGCSYWVRLVETALPAVRAA